MLALVLVLAVTAVPPRLRGLEVEESALAVQDAAVGRAGTELAGAVAEEAAATAEAEKLEHAVEKLEANPAVQLEHSVMEKIEQNPAVQHAVLEKLEASPAVQLEHAMLDASQGFTPLPTKPRSAGGSVYSQLEAAIAEMDRHEPLVPERQVDSQSVTKFAEAAVAAGEAAKADADLLASDVASEVESEDQRRARRERGRGEPAPAPKASLVAALKTVASFAVGALLGRMLPSVTVSCGAKGESCDTLDAPHAYPLSYAAPKTPKCSLPTPGHESA